MIDFRKEVIGFNLANNTNSAYNVNITNGAGFPPQLSVNATTKYQWTINLIDWSVGTGYIFIPSGIPNYINLFSYILGDINSIINGLNGLNFGTFNYTFIGGTSYNIYTYNNNYAFGELSSSD
jgi:hypothetical protein